jgi:superfamily II DNA or RNA helicase
MKLYKHQEKFSIDNPNVALLVWGLGSGKTRSAIEWSKTRPSPLIICPKGLKENWRRECVKWGLRYYKIISKEEFKRDVKLLKHKTLIVDEADWFYSPLFKSKMAKAMKWYLKENDPHRLFLTGTPVRSSAWNAYSALWFINVQLSYMAFKNDHFTDIRMGFRTIPVPRKDSAEKVRELINKHANVYDPNTDFDIPEQTDETIYVEETKDQGKAHKANPEILPIVRFTRDHQIESGVGVPVDPKLERVLQIATDNDKIIVVCRYREQLERYACVLEAENFVVFQIHGDVKDRSGVLDKVEAIKKCVLLIQSATCEGFEAPSVAVMVFASMDYSYRNYTQMKGRILRMNALHKNVYVHLVAGACDEAIMEAMSEKRDFDVIAYMKKVTK